MDTSDCAPARQLEQRLAECYEQQRSPAAHGRAIRSIKRAAEPHRWQPVRVGPACPRAPRWCRAGATPLQKPPRPTKYERPDCDRYRLRCSKEALRGQPCRGRPGCQNRHPSLQSPRVRFERCRWRRRFCPPPPEPNRHQVSQTRSATGGSPPLLRHTPALPTHDNYALPAHLLTGRFPALREARRATRTRGCRDIRAKPGKVPGLPRCAPLQAASPTPFRHCDVMLPSKLSGATSQLVAAVRSESW